MGYIGAYGKKQFSALGEPVNLAALLCADAEAGTVLIDRGSFERAGFEPLRAKTVRLRSRKLQQRLEAVSLRYGGRGVQRPTWLPAARPDSLAEGV
jgi:class 3 adenylate cyclase